ncbi:MAG: sporulation protein YtfJ [Clostridia bacterium]|nr:sporulation protein YtfJ [Clostridia bacterium]
MSENNIQNIMETSLDKLRTMVDADTIIGTPLCVGDVTLIPVSRVSFGLATGGGDLPSKSDTKSFGGGSGAGVSIVPIAFISVCGKDVRMMPVYNNMNTVDKAINLAPDLFDKIKSLFSKQEIKFDNEGNIIKDE